MVIEVRGDDGTRWAAGVSITETVHQLVRQCERYRAIVKDLQEQLDKANKGEGK